MIVKNANYKFPEAEVGYSSHSIEYYIEEKKTDKPFKLNYY